MTRETLDEAIDRVAASMTAAAHDVAAVAHVESALDRPDARRRDWMLAASVALAIAGTFAVWQTSETPSSGRVADAGLPATAPAPLPPVDARPAGEPTVRGDAADVGPEAPRQAAQAARARALDAEDSRAAQVTAIAALPSPSSLVIEELELHDLNVSPVALDELTVQNLDVPEIGDAGGRGEQP